MAQSVFLSSRIASKMSSHHFVKEEQEPALIIADASALSFEKLQELLEWSPTVIVMEPALEAALAWGFKIDAAVVSHSTLHHWKTVLTQQMPLKILSSHGEDALSVAFYFLITNKQLATNLVAKWDKNLAAHLAEFKDRLSIVILTEHLRWLLMVSGRLERWLPANGAVHISNLLVDDEIIQIQKDGIFILERAAPFWVGVEW